MPPPNPNILLDKVRQSLTEMQETLQDLNSELQLANQPTTAQQIQKLLTVIHESLHPTTATLAPTSADAVARYTANLLIEDINAFFKTKSVNFTSDGHPYNITEEDKKDFQELLTRCSALFKEGEPAYKYFFMGELVNRQFFLLFIFQNINIKPILLANPPEYILEYMVRLSSVKGSDVYVREDAKKRFIEQLFQAILNNTNITEVKRKKLLVDFMCAIMNGNFGYCKHNELITQILLILKDDLHIHDSAGKSILFAAAQAVGLFDSHHGPEEWTLFILNHQTQHSTTDLESALFKVIKFPYGKSEKTGQASATTEPTIKKLTACLTADPQWKNYLLARHAYSLVDIFTSGNNSVLHPECTAAVYYLTQFPRNVQADIYDRILQADHPEENSLTDRVINIANHSDFNIFYFLSQRPDLCKRIHEQYSCPIKIFNDTYENSRWRERLTKTQGALLRDRCSVTQNPFVKAVEHNNQYFILILFQLFVETIAPWQGHDNDLKAAIIKLNLNRTDLQALQRYLQSYANSWLPTDRYSLQARLAGEIHWHQLPTSSKTALLSQFQNTQAITPTALTQSKTTVELPDTYDGGINDPFLANQFRGSTLRKQSE